jgi:hypothetical protein
MFAMRGPVRVNSIPPESLQVLQSDDGTAKRNGKRYPLLMDRKAAVFPGNPLCRINLCAISGVRYYVGGSPRIPDQGPHSEVLRRFPRILPPGNGARFTLILRLTFRRPRQLPPIENSLRLLMAH